MRNEMTNLTWEKVYDEFDKLIRYAANDVAYQYKTVYQSSEDLYQDGLIILYQCFEKYGDKDLEEFGAIFKTSLWRAQRRNAKVEMVESMRLAENLPAKCGKVGVNTAEEESSDLAFNSNLDEAIAENDTYQRVLSLLDNDPACKLVLKELVDPSERTIWECKMDRARKRTTGVTGWNEKEFTITRMHIARALNLSYDALGVIVRKLELAYTAVRPNDVRYHDKVNEKPENKKQDWSSFSCEILKEFCNKKGISFMEVAHKPIQKMRLLESLKKHKILPEDVEQVMGKVEKKSKPVWKHIDTATLLKFAESKGISFKDSDNPTVQRLRLVTALNEAGSVPADVR